MIGYDLKVTSPELDDLIVLMDKHVGRQGPEPLSGLLRRAIVTRTGIQMAQDAAEAEGEEPVLGPPSAADYRREATPDDADAQGGGNY